MKQEIRNILNDPDNSGKPIHIVNELNDLFKSTMKDLIEHLGNNYYFNSDCWNNYLTDEAESGETIITKFLEQ